MHNKITWMKIKWDEMYSLYVEQWLQHGATKTKDIGSIPGIAHS